MRLYGRAKRTVITGQHSHGNSAWPLPNCARSHQTAPELRHGAYITLLRRLTTCVYVIEAWFR